MIQNERSRDEFLNRLPQADRINLETLVEAFQATSQTSEFAIALVGVGGVLTKDWPRKDMDVVLILDDADAAVLPNREDYPNNWEFALAEFGLIRLLVEDATQGAGAEIKQVILPSYFEELQDPNMIRGDGSITIQFSSGIPVEIIRSAVRNIGDFKASQTRPYAVLFVNP
jgi:hypothetical protein